MYFKQRCLCNWNKHKTLWWPSGSSKCHGSCLIWHQSTSGHLGQMDGRLWTHRKEVNFYNKSAMLKLQTYSSVKQQPLPQWRTTDGWDEHKNRQSNPKSDKFSVHFGRDCEVEEMKPVPVYLHIKKSGSGNFCMRNIEIPDTCMAVFGLCLCLIPTYYKKKQTWTYAGGVETQAWSLHWQANLADQWTSKAEQSCWWKTGKWWVHSVHGDYVTI